MNEEITPQPVPRLAIIGAALAILIILTILVVGLERVGRLDVELPVEHQESLFLDVDLDGDQDYVLSIDYVRDRSGEPEPAPTPPVELEPDPDPMLGPS